MQRISKTEDKRQLFLSKTIGYGHLDLLSIQDVRIISRSQLYSTLNPSNATEQWFWELLNKADDGEVKVGYLRDSISRCRSQCLFFSEPEVFLAYLEREALPIFTQETQLRVVLITPLPDDLLGLLEPSRFWGRWVSGPF